MKNEYDAERETAGTQGEHEAERKEVIAREQNEAQVSGHGDKGS